jgi:Zn-dependent peptidase ImmA (M78 family)
MVELKTSYTLSRIPYMTYDAIEEYAEQVVEDFSPERLSKPGPLDVDRFLEYYLGLNVDYRKLCYGQRILGMTAFNDGTVEVMDEETGEVFKLPVTEGTVVIDSSLDSKRNEPRRRFTMTHEGCHWLLHREAFAEDNPYGPAGIYENQYLAAKEGRVDYRRYQKKRTDTDCMERQADFMASVLLMPRPALRKVYKAHFLACGETPRQLVRGVNPMEDSHIQQVTDLVAKTFNVSKRAALIRLEKLEAIVDKGRRTIK